VTAMIGEQTPRAPSPLLFEEKKEPDFLKMVRKQEDEVGIQEY